MDTLTIRAAILPDGLALKSREKVRPRKGDQRGTKPRSRPLASIGGSNASHFRVITRCDFETGRCSNSRFSMSELGQRSWSNRFALPTALFGLVVDQASDLRQALAVAAAADHVGHATLGPKQGAILILL